MKRSRFTKEQNGAQYHSQTQGQIERWHQTLKKRIALNDYGLAGDLKHQINDFFAARENASSHESFKNPIPAYIYFGRAETILAARQCIERETLKHRRLQHHLPAA